MSEIKNIVLIGAGNVAWHLGQQLVNCGLEVSFVWSRNEEKAVALATQLGCARGTNLRNIPPAADLYIIAVRDDAIAVVAKQLADFILPQALVMHTSGATPSTVLLPFFSRFGAFYPLQTFSRERAINFRKIPLCLYTSATTDYALVMRLAEKLTDQVFAVTDEQRVQLHLAAIFVNNFTNYLQHISRSLTESYALPGHLLQPLLEETIQKLQDLSPAEAQTGPAIRQDQATIDRHLHLLSDHPQWSRIYAALTAGIQEDLGE